ncbi:MAG: aldose 1-epimerase family protein [Ruminococcaceae bacterium]|nr:aldose 1-epimerase family protein [Oscillospiraceae bacterium]
MIKLHNKLITVKIDKVGAEMRSIVCDGREILWQGDKNSWARTAPTLFPFCGGFKNGKYTYGGTEYECAKHGFAKNSEFEVEKKSKKRVTLLLKSNEETLKQYPFEFELRVTFTISHKSVIIEYDVRNKTDGEMYFSIGSHEGYICSGSIENYDLLFPRRESLQNCIVEQGVIGKNTEQITKFTKTLPLLERHLASDSLVFKNMASRSVILRNRTNGERLKIDFPGFNYFVIWSIPGNEYICLEPWAGFPDYIDTTEKIEDRTGIVRLRKKGKKKFMHKITVMEKL